MPPAGPPAVASALATAFVAVWTGIALLTAIHPRLVWRTTQAWKARTIPPPLYFWAMRAGGAVCAALGLALFALSLAHR